MKTLFNHTTPTGLRIRVIEKSEHLTIVIDDTLGNIASIWPFKRDGETLMRGLRAWLKEVEPNSVAS